MIATFFEIENILKTLPTGYYIGRMVPAKLTHEDASYYMPMDDKICVSYPMLEQAMIKLGDKISDKNIESIVRTLLYHEISHAFITPTHMEMSRVLNIFEDERIETIFKNYYKMVDFKQFLMLMNDWDGSTKVATSATSAINAWYYLCRYDIGKPELIKEKKLIILTYSNINRFSDYWLVQPYVDAVNALFNKVKLDFDEEQEKQENKYSNKNNTKNDDNNTQDCDNTDAENEDEENEDENEDEENEDENEDEENEDENEDEENEDENEDEENEDENEDEENEDENEDDVFNNEACAKLFEAAQIYNNQNLQIRLANIILAKKKVQKSNGSAINAYSGVFNPLSVVREDYKWFVQQNRQGNVKQFAKIKLNLFIDKSGSFSSNENDVNALLFALQKLEQADNNFTFDLITINTSINIVNKQSRILHCGGGNTLPENTSEIVKKVQDKQALNYNIVLFDGDALSDSYGYKTDAMKRFTCFNMPNTCIIYERSNAFYIDKYCRNIKKICCTKYVTELIEQTCVALNELFK